MGTGSPKSCQLRKVHGARPLTKPRNASRAANQPRVNVRLRSRNHARATKANGSNAARTSASAAKERPYSKLLRGPLRLRRPRTEKHNGGEQERRRHAIGEGGGVENPERMKGAQQTGQDGDKETAKRSPSEEEIQPRRQSAQSALQPAHRRRQRGVVFDQPTDDGHQNGIAGRNMSYGYIPPIGRGEEGKALLIFEIADQPEQIPQRRWLLDAQRAGIAGVIGAAYQVAGTRAGGYSDDHDQQ